MSRAHLGHFKKYFAVHIYFLLVNLDARRESWKVVVAEITNFLPIFMIPFLKSETLYFTRYMTTQDKNHISPSLLQPGLAIQGCTGQWDVRRKVYYFSMLLSSFHWPDWGCRTEPSVMTMVKMRATAQICRATR